MIRNIIVLITLGLLITFLGHSQPYAIPGALGLAKNVRGAYAGSSSPKILIVDRLTDDSGNNGSNKGSLRWCLTQSGPRIILFEVSGYINLNSYIRVTNDYISIYGQTAPSPGITISGVDAVDFRCDNVVLQHLRFRSAYAGSSQIDAMSLYNADNFFADHCSFSYAKDESVGISGSSDDRSGVITFQNCIFSNPLAGKDGKGLLAGRNVVSASVLRSAFIHCGIRSPYPNGSSYTKWENINTIAYNPAYWGQELSEGNNPELNIIGNVWKAGPNTNGQRQVVRFRTSLSSGAKAYLYNNYSPRRVGSSEWNGVAVFQDSRDSSNYKVDTPFSWGETNYYTYDVLEDSLVANAGARPWDRDSVDIIALKDMVDETGSWITSQSEAYYPKLAENSIILDIPSSPHTNSGNGYTNLEMWAYNIEKGGITSAQDIEMPNYMNIYPNPVSDCLTISGTAISRYKIFNSSGKLIDQDVAKENEIRVNVSHYLPGVYIATIEEEGKSYSLKFIKD